MQEGRCLRANDSDLNFRISVNVWLSTPGASGLLFFLSCAPSCKFSESQTSPGVSDLRTYRRVLGLFLFSIVRRSSQACKCGK